MTKRSRTSTTTTTTNRSLVAMAAATAATVALVAAAAVVVVAIHGRDAVAASNSNESDDATPLVEGKRQYQSRPAIPDANQSDKIRRWNQRLFEELLSAPSSASSSSSATSTTTTTNIRQPRRRRRRLDTMTIDHHSSKTSDGGDDNDEEGAHQFRLQQPVPQSQFQQQQMHNMGPPTQPLQLTDIDNNDDDGISDSDGNDDNITGGGDNGTGGGGGGNNGSHFYYYPMYTSTLTIGTCTNNGNEPDRYHNNDSTNNNNFLFNTLEECCQAWYVDVMGCTVGNAFPAGEHDQLLIRDTLTGELLSGKTTISNSSVEGGDSGEDIGMAFQSAPGDENVDTNVVVGGSNQHHYQYYPSFDAILYPDGACLNDGNAPVEYIANPRYFFFETNRDCCEEWYLDVDACLDGAATTASSAAAAAAPASSAGGGDDIPESSSLHNKDEEEGEETQEEDSTVWPTWADDDQVGQAVSLWPTWADDDIKMEEDVMVNIGDTSGTLWPTWSTADEGEQEDDNNEEEDDMSSVAAEISLSAPDVDDTSTTPSNNSMKAPSSEEYYALYDSFETGDFTKYDWATPTHTPSSSEDDFTLGSYSDNNSDSRNMDAWEVDRTSMAYDGNYAARAGMLRSPGSQSNLTITLEGLDVSRGGLLIFAIRAMVEMPVDALYLTVDDQVVRTYDKVTIGSSSEDSGNDEWEEDSLMLLPGQHVVTWSYQYFGMPKAGDPEFETYKMDPRRIGNSWVDAIALEPLTGDAVWPDSGEGTQLILQNSHGGGNDVPEWSLVTDAHAFLGEHSFIAYTKDITSSSRNYAEISWTVVAGPAGGVLSFAAFGSIFAPLDILEFRVDGVPQVALTIPTTDWEEHFINIEPGKHSLKWRLLKNAPGLSDEIIDNMEAPEGYQGYAKIDGIKYVENEVYMTSTTSTSSISSTTTILPDTTTEATSTTEMTSTTTETTTSTTTVASDETMVSTSETPMQEAKAEVTTSTTSTTTVASDPTSTSTTSTEPVQEAQSTATGCPEGLKPVDGLPNCCLEEPNYLGDGACDPSAPYNTEECAFDLGDCCYETCNTDSPYGCLTVEGNAEEVGPFGFFCLDPRYSVIDEEKCKVENRGWIGDGGCDAEGGYNTEECGWDMGDCCEETCNEEFSFYPCGSHQPYTCINPQYSGEEGATDSSEASKATDLPPTTTTVPSEESSTSTTSGLAEIETSSSSTAQPSESPEVTTTVSTEVTVSSTTSATETTSTAATPSEDSETISTSTTPLPATTTPEP